MNKNNIKKYIPDEWKPMRQRRFYFISKLYQVYLMHPNLKLELFKFEDEISGNDKELIFQIIALEPFYIKIIEKFIQGHLTFSKLLPLVKAILIFAIAEHKYEASAVVISEAVEISKQLVIEKKHVGFINAILDNVFKALDKGKEKNAN